MKVERIQGRLVNHTSIKNSNIIFKRNYEEHVGWGAKFIRDTGKTNFKLFTYPDTKNVFVEIAKNVSENLGNIKTRIVSIIGTVGSVLTIDNVVSKDEKSEIYKMNNNGEGVFSLDGVESKAGQNYRYIIVDKNNNVNIVKDPYSKKQMNIHGWSEIYDQNNYEWQNIDWIEGKDARRIIRKPNEKLRGLDSLIIDEINIPTISQKGNFEEAKKRIDTIADRGIATAIEIMPVENTYSQQWGYDGVDKFAVNENLGSPDDLKSLVDYAHGKGLNVIMDMVPNHMGPDGDYLMQTGPYEKGYGPFGGEFNYEGKNNQFVRDWMVNAALWWANEFKVDGLRLDMTKFCGSDYLLKQIVTEVNEHAPKVFLIAEDGRENKESVTRYEKNNMTHNDSLNFIDSQVENISERGWFTTPANIGFDSEWDFKFMHALKSIVFEASDNALNEFDSNVRNSNYRVKYVMSHDEIGNEDGTRLIPKILSQNLGLFFNVSGNSDAEKGQKAAHLSQALVKLIVSDKFSNMNEEELKQEELNLGLQRYISKKDLSIVFDMAVAKHKLALGTVMTTPGPKMYFQGDDEMDLSYFKFFRVFSDELEKRALDKNFAQNIINQKGYDTINSQALNDSKLGSVELSNESQILSKKIIKYNQDLVNLLKNEKVLCMGDVIETYKDHNHKVHIHKLKYNDDEVLVIKNFGNNFHNKSYKYWGFPQNSTWKEIFNSDDINYGGSGYVNNTRDDITNLNQNLSLAPNSLLILKKL